MKLFIRNRSGKKIAVLVDKPKTVKGLAFVMHGHGGYKEQPHIVAFAKTFFDEGYIVVRFDMRNSIGESDGRCEDSSVTGAYEDLEDVIGWAKGQDWYQEPFFLCGHSLGGLCVGLYAERHPEEVRGLVPVSAVVSGKLSLQTYEQEMLKRWKETGYDEVVSKSRPGLVKRWPYSYIEDKLRYDLLKDAAKLTMPVCIIVGENDSGHPSTPPDHQRLLYNALPSQKEIHIIRGADHGFRGEGQLDQVEKAIRIWLSDILDTRKKKVGEAHTNNR